MTFTINIRGYFYGLSPARIIIFYQPLIDIFDKVLIFAEL